MLSLIHPKFILCKMARSWFLEIFDEWLYKRMNLFNLTYCQQFGYAVSYLPLFLLGYLNLILAIFIIWVVHVLVIAPCVKSLVYALPCENYLGTLFTVLGHNYTKRFYLIFYLWKFCQRAFRPKTFTHSKIKYFTKKKSRFHIVEVLI